MPRLRDRATGAVVIVDDATAALLGGGYEPADPKPEPKADPKRRAPAGKK